MDHHEYEKFLELYKNLLGYNNPDANKARILQDAQEQANHHHALSLLSPLRDQLYALASLAQQLTNKNAKYFMLYGAARRASLILRAYRGVISVAYENRTDALSPDEQVELNQDIQSIYIHMLGLVDNFAWCLLYENHADLADRFRKYPSKLGLFSSDFQAQCIPPSLIDEIKKPHGLWYEDVRDRRNPIAHQIPPYVPPAFLTSHEELTHADLFSRFWDNLKNSNRTDADLALVQMDTIGTFSPYFVYHPDEDPIPIYPTIPSDLRPCD